MTFDGDSFTTLILKYRVLTSHLEIMAMFTRHLSVEKISGPGCLGLGAQVIAGFRPQKSGPQMCELDAREWLPVKQKSDSIGIQAESQVRICTWKKDNRKLTIDKRTKGSVTTAKLFLVSVCASIIISSGRFMCSWGYRELLCQTHQKSGWASRATEGLQRVKRSKGSLNNFVKKWFVDGLSQFFSALSFGVGMLQLQSIIKRG